MKISYTRIKQWADTRDAQAQLPVLVRRLIRTTTPRIEKMSFPGGDAVNLPGFDGITEIEDGSEWVPEGKTVWEMGCDKSVSVKSNGDYKKRTDEMPPDERKKITFVFVTPRVWTGKDDWSDAKRAEGDWKDVRAYDASTLDQWLESSNSTSVWLAERLDLFDPNIETPLAFWSRWSNSSQPKISEDLVVAGREKQVVSLIAKLRSEETRSLTISADDKGEALAFLVASCLQREAWDLLDRMVVTSNPNRLRQVSSSEKPIVALNSNEPIHEEFPDLSLVVAVRAYARGQLLEPADVDLPYIQTEQFCDELQKMGLSEDRSKSIAEEAGFSLTVLRRRLSDDQAIRAPSWANSNEIKRKVLPFAFAGSWLDSREGDWLALEFLSGKSRSELERDFAEIHALDGSPFVSIDRTYNSVSQIDALFALGNVITSDDVNQLFQIAEMILGERDPALDLPETEWWMANIQGKEHPFSGALTQGISNTVCILAIYGEAICGRRLGFDLSGKCFVLVQKLLSDLNAEQWLSIRNRLRLLAETSPEAFLGGLERELARPEPAIKSIMRVVEGGVTGECLRTDLLWALETLAWEPQYLPRVSSILLRLCKYKTEDNWGNKPENTLASFFRSWLPMTSANIEMRNGLLAQLIKEKRGPSFELCMSIIPSRRGGFASENVKPRWRRFNTQRAQLTNNDVFDAQEGARQVLLAAAPYSKTELHQLIDRLEGFRYEDQQRIRDGVLAWLATKPEQKEIAELRDKVRSVLRWLSRQEEEGDRNIYALLRPLYDALESQDLTEKHRWLFDQHWVEWPDVDRPDDYDLKKHDALIKKCRKEAIAEIFGAEGTSRVFKFAVEMTSPRIAAITFMSEMRPEANVVEFAQLALGFADQIKAKEALRGLFYGLADDELRAALAEVFRVIGDKPELRDFVIECVPSTPPGWNAVEELGQHSAEHYWRNVQFYNYWLTNEELGTVIDKLLAAQRPRTAYDAAHIHPGNLTGSHWVCILEGILKGDEPEGILPDRYHLEEIFEHLEQDQNISDQVIARLEFPFVRVLSDGKRQTKALDRIMASDPSFFVQILSYLYRRRDDGEDPDEWKIDDPERAKDLAEKAYEVLRSWRAFRGLNSDGTFDAEAFASWNREVRKLAAEVGRLEVANITLGEAYAYSPTDIDGNWPSMPVCDLLDEFDGNDMRRGFRTGVHNSRGTFSKSPYEGGEKESNLAEKYRLISDRLHNSHPRLAATFREIEQSYLEQAKREDERAVLRDRWNR